LDCEHIATGHYAHIRNENDRFIISKGVDVWKDQSYVLWGVSQDSLSRTMLPLGHLHKSEIREMAKERGFFDLVNKSESYEICFVPDNDYRGFLKRRIPTLEKEVAGGNFVLENGTVVGKHEGYPFYTVGQRKGLGIALGRPVFVTEIRKDSNEVVLGDLPDLLRDGMYVSKLNLQKYDSITQPVDTVTKVRYKHDGAPATISQEGPDKLKVLFHEEVNGIAPGQAAVFYEGNDVIGGGWITKSFRSEAAEERKVKSIIV
jgi:tRNA-specific 2-thiouridylase